MTADAKTFVANSATNFGWQIKDTVEKKGRKIFSQGVWASAATIERIRADLEAERSTNGFATDPVSCPELPTSLPSM